MGRPATVIAIVVIAAAAMFFWMRRAPSDSAGNASSTDQLALKKTKAKAKDPGAAGGRAGKNNMRTRRPLPKGVRKLKALEDRERLLRAIKAARMKREGREPTTESTAANNTRTARTGPKLPPLPPKGKLDKKYIQSVVRSARPLIRECYTLARDSSPNLHGQIIVEFTISGEKHVGGLVETARITTDNELSRNKTLSECITQTMLSLEYPAPEGGGTVTVKYPFLFRQTKPN